VYETVPCGVKKNVMFKVKVHRENQMCKFWDDCGAWEGTHGKKASHLPGEVTEQRTLPYGRYNTWKNSSSVSSQYEVKLTPTVVSDTFQNRQLTSVIRRSGQ